MKDFQQKQNLLSFNGMADSKERTIPKWLEELQQRSWEPEILLSGIVLYGIFNVPELLDQFLDFFKLNIFGNSQDINNLVALFKMGIDWLIGSLILHLICRGVWIGMVVLSYAFPDGIQMDDISYKGWLSQKRKIDLLIFNPNPSESGSSL